MTYHIKILDSAYLFWNSEIERYTMHLPLPNATLKEGDIIEHRSVKYKITKALHHVDKYMHYGSPEEEDIYYIEFLPLTP